MSQAVEAIYERGVLRPLQPLELAEGQRVAISLEPVALSPEEMQALASRVYEGLTDEEIDEVEAIALDRSNFVRPLVEDEP